MKLKYEKDGDKLIAKIDDVTIEIQEQIIYDYTRFCVAVWNKKDCKMYLNNENLTKAKRRARIIYNQWFKK